MQYSIARQRPGRGPGGLLLTGDLTTAAAVAAAVNADHAIVSTNDPGMHCANHDACVPVTVSMVVAACRQKRPPAASSNASRPGCRETEQGKLIRLEKDTQVNSTQCHDTCSNKDLGEEEHRVPLPARRPAYAAIPGHSLMMM